MNNSETAGSAEAVVSPIDQCCANIACELDVLANNIDRLVAKLNSICASVPPTPANKDNQEPASAYEGSSPLTSRLYELRDRMRTYNNHINSLISIIEL